MSTPRKPRTNTGFSLLEVMVAIAILGLGLTAILSAQAGAFATATQARSMSVATGLARCKMLELEQKLNRDGFPEIDENDSGPCCDSDDREAMRCTWRIEKPQMPEPRLGQLDLNGGLDLSGKGGSPGGGGPAAAMGALASLAPAAGIPSDAKIGDVAQGVTGAVAQTGGVDAIAGMAMSLVYPTLKKYFEAGTRRIIVSVHWADGNKDRTLEILQWYTKAVAPPPAATGTGTSATGSAPGSPGGTGLPGGLGR